MTMPKKKSNLPTVRKAMVIKKESAKVPGPATPLTLEELRKPHAALSAHAFVKFIPPTVEQTEFIREGLKKGLKMAEIKKLWEDRHAIT